MKLTSIILLFTIYYSFCFCQNETNNWFFGNQIGVTFNTTPPEFVNGGQIPNISSYSEGTSSISDNQGNLLLYSNGQKVWNFNHTILENGDSLLGNYSSTQSSIFIPLPNSHQKYLLFAIGDIWESNQVTGLTYSVIDMCANNGNGLIEKHQKNIPVMDSVYEKLTACLHQNGRDYWVVTHKLETNNFYSFLIDETGVRDTVISSVGAISDKAQGQIKISPNGDKISVSHVQMYYGNYIFQVLDFDNSNGQVSAPKTLTVPNNSLVYGSEFSPDNLKLYAYYTNLNTGSGIIQYDLSVFNENTINSSSHVVYHENNISAGRTMQLGPDFKIYLPGLFDSNKLISIEEPNQLGSLCSINTNGITLGNQYASIGLPNFVAGLNYAETKECNYLGNSNLSELQVKLVRISDITGKETKNTTNCLLLYHYSDGSVRKVFRINN